MKYFILGVYFCGFVATLLIVGSFAVLGGRTDDLWFALLCAALWPVMVPYLLWGVVQ